MGVDVDTVEASDHDRPCFSFGVIADVQYADVEDGYNYAKTHRRYYRGALKMLQVAVNSWNTDPRIKPSFVLQLGDIIDGINKRENITLSSLETILKVFSEFREPIYHIWGNHEYYNFTREALLQSKIYSGNEKHSCPVPGKAYYSCSPHPRLKLLALDCYEISMLASSVESEEHHKATQYLKNNYNEDKNSSEGLIDLQQRFVRFNGAVGKHQLDWVRMNLQQAELAKQNVIVMGHCSVYCPASSASCLCWDAPELLQLLQDYSHCVVCYFAGHDHAGGMAMDHANILHMTMPGVLENNEQSDFGTVYVHNDRIQMMGNGRVPTVKIPLRYTLNTSDS